MLKSLKLARVLLVGDELASRLTLQTILQAGGYSVDVADSAEDAFSKLDRGEYELVFSEEEMGAPGAGQRVLAYARAHSYAPATAFVTAYKDAKAFHYPSSDEQRVAINSDNVSDLLSQAANLLARRARRRSSNRVLARASE